MSASVPRFLLVLVENYRADRQQSMLRYAEILRYGVPLHGVAVQSWVPPFLFGRLVPPAGPLFKWFAYLDKYAVFPAVLLFRSALLRLSGVPAAVHICDHSNAPYAWCLAGLPCVATCHDVGAIRGALGELDDCPATGLGRFLQRLIAAGLRRIAAVGAIACVSEATRGDLLRLVVKGDDASRVRVIVNGLNQSFAHTAEASLAALRRHRPGFGFDWPFVLHVGSGLARKNREGVLRVFAAFRRSLGPEWPGRLVLVGDPLSPALLALRDHLGLAREKVVVLKDPPSAVLEGCYRNAFALLFPSRFEGFGWPVAEAQVCGCPVLTTTVSSLPEVAGKGACLRDPDDEDGFVSDLQRLLDPDFRAALVERGLENVRRFTPEEMVSRFVRLYEEILRLP